MIQGFFRTFRELGQYQTRTYFQKFIMHRNVLQSISTYQTQTTPYYFYNKTRVRVLKSKPSHINPI